MAARGPLLLLILGLSLLTLAVAGAAGRLGPDHIPRTAIPLIAGIAFVLTSLFWRRSMQAAIAHTLASAERELELRRIAHDRLIEREQWNRNFFENNPLIMFLVDPDTDRIADANPAACRFYGYSRQKLMQMTVTDLHTVSPDEVHASMQQALRGTIGPLTFRHRLADRSPRTVSVTTGPLWTGGRTMLFCIVHDVTAQVEAQRSIDRIVHASPMGCHLYQLDSEGTLILASANPAADRIFGTPHHELLGQPVEQAFPGENLRPVLQRYAEIARDGGRWQFNDFTYSADERQGMRGHGVFDVTAFQVTPGTVAVMFQDVTGRVQQQEQLRQAKQEAESANAAKDRFLAGLSHELRTPLTPVILSVKAMLANAMLPESAHEDLLEVQHQVELEACLISDLLDVTSIVRGQFRIHPCQCDLHVILRRAMNLCRADALARSQRVELRLKAQSRFVYGDPARLQQVFWNLIRNAVKFTPEEGTITITTHNVRGEIVCEIADSGIGMDSQTLSRLFEAFEKGPAGAAGRSGGLGVGLAIAQAIVEKHSGRITATSPGPNAGSRFSVGLMAAESPIELPPHPATSSHRARKVLLIEDDPGTLRSLARLLRLWKYDVTTASCAAGALAASARGHFDLIISDVGLPDGTGPAILPQLRQHNDVPAIAISGFGMEHDIRSSLRAGFSDHLIKPINPDTLQQVIQRLLCPVTA